MCANPKSIREIMIAAEELKMIDNGEYVFFNIEIFGSLNKESKPWFDQNDTSVRNNKARKAYQALLTITTKKPEDDEYQEFSNQVKNFADEISRNYFKLISMTSLAIRSSCWRKKSTITHSTSTSKSANSCQPSTMPFYCSRKL